MNLITDLPEAAQKAAAVMLKYTWLDSIAIAVESLNNSQMAYSLLTSINKKLRNSYKTEISLYSATKDLPLMTPLCSVYNINELKTYTGILICTNFRIWYSSEELSPRSTKIYYVYDPLELTFVKPEFIAKLKGNLPILAVRHENHLEFLQKQLQIKPDKKLIVPEFDFDIIEKELIL